MKKIPELFSHLTSQYDPSELFELWWLIGNHIADSQEDIFLKALEAILKEPETSNMPMPVLISQSVIARLAEKQADMIIKTLEAGKQTPAKPTPKRNEEDFN
jgi:hypothetical protein